MLVGMDSELSLNLKHLFSVHKRHPATTIQTQKRLGTLRMRFYIGEMPPKPCERQKQEQQQHGGDEQTFVEPGRGTWSWPLTMHLAACATRASRSRANTARLVR